MNLLRIRAGRRKLSDTGETIFVKHYLIRRLEILRHKQKNKEGGFRFISFQKDRELADLLQISERFSSKESLAQKQRSLRATVLQILGYYKEIEYIGDYQESARGVKILGTVHDPWELPEARSNT